MKKPNPTKYNANKYLRAYLIAIQDQLAFVLAKLHMLQHGICKDGKGGGVDFLDPKRERFETSLRTKYSEETSTELAHLIGLIDKPARKSNRRK
jgi:hypothetical protein